MTQRPDELAPETVNDEQKDEAGQAQSVAEEAAARATAPRLRETEKVKGGIREEDDIEDLVDHMNQMDTSGTIDMSAYDGEETMDDLENRYGRDNGADPEFADDDS